MNETTPQASLIAPHGGELCERLITGPDADVLVDEALHLPSLTINRRVLSDLRLLGIGALSPLTGFMNKDEYLSVIRDMRLLNGLVWPIPITLPIGAMEARELRSNRVALMFEGNPVAIVDITDVYQPDRRAEALAVYRVDDPRHPGVNEVYAQGEFYVGGTVHVLDLVITGDDPLDPYILTPREIRHMIAEKGWRTVVAFQTRNPIHRAHEYLQKCALEMVDGLMIHPLVGETKSDDIDAHTRLHCYETILSKYYPQDRVILAAFPANMRYAGPKEAIFHALCRKNYGCTHFIVGRDHAGVGTYYGTYDAQRIFDRFSPEEIGIEPLRFEHAFYCTTCQGMATAKTCPHDQSDHITLSGTKVREMVHAGHMPPLEFTRPEVASILIAANKAVSRT